MRYRLIAAAFVFCSFGMAQITNYAGPGIATTGSDAIGTRSGQDLDFKYFAGVRGIYDNGLVPLQVDPTGKITDLGSLPGVEANIGAYGSHSWRRVRLGLDYNGAYRRYQQSTSYNGLTQQAVLGLKYQWSRKIVFDAQGSVGTLNQGSSILASNSAVIGGIVDQNSLLFDNRSTYYQVGTDMNYLASSRTYYTIGGSGYTLRRKSSALVGVNGYNLHGSVSHRVSKTLEVGASFQHMHYDYPRAFGDSDINVFAGNISKQLGRAWKISLSGGVYQIETQGIESVAIDPAIAALLGTSVTSQTFYKKSWLPNASARVARQFRYAAFSVDYNRSVTPGNGVYLSSQQESYGSSINFTGGRKWSFFLNGNRSKLDSIGVTLAPYNAIMGGAGATYSITKEFQLTSNYQFRHQEVTQGGFRRNSSSVSLGLYYSPGSTPISFH